MWNRESIPMEGRGWIAVSRKSGQDQMSQLLEPKARWQLSNSDESVRHSVR